MLVPVNQDMIKNIWIFLKPLSTGMWFGSIILLMYTGLVIWLLEYLNGNEHVHGPFSLKQLGTTMFFSIFKESE
jgi:ionotropic glutamate receptor